MKNPLTYIDNLLNRITMYKLAAYGLRVLIGLAITFSLTGQMSLSAAGILVSAIILVGVCYGANWLFGKLYRVPNNKESYLITALILCCILPPTTTVERGVYIGLAGLIAIAAKYLVAWRHKHLFNPAAFVAVVVGVAALLPVTWWIGNPTMLPFVLLFGLLIVRKLRRTQMYAVFIVASLAVGVIVAMVHGNDVGNHARNMILSGPLFFLGGVMLTEPATMPPTRYYRYLFALLTAVLFAGQLHLGSFYVSPELSLVLANILAFSVGLRQRVTLTLVEAHQMSTNVYDFVFKPSSRFMFKPGQYLEWTLALPHVDGRGNRRTFTIASSPTEELVHLGIKFYEPSSAFKTMLHSMKPGEKIHTGQLAGDFTMPADHRKKLVWIAGGIGITPFRAQAQYLIDARQTRDITLLYFVSKPEERSYAEVFEAARAVGVKTVYVLSTKDAPANWRGKQGALTPELLKQEVPNFASRTFYISGPPAMVRGYKQLLTSVGVQRKNIKTDYFSGY